MGDQIALFEPTGTEVGKLALQHLKRATEARRTAEVCLSRGWSALAHQKINAAEHHEFEAECLAMLADFERLGGVKS
jgi:hypothetical protein